MLTPYSSRADAQPLVSVASLVMIALSAVPASPPLIPALAMTIRTAVASSMLMPMDAQVAATFL